ncbi:nucleotidyltransferase family protein [Aquirufa sp. HETE-83D]|uniref:Nucleotidyltransferase family protein n=1 Tax=Aquirufa esocilacus TaxID=3096513 RepID=A0ABW6DLE8_9BACT
MKEVIILAGGFGTRLKSVVSDLPKCLAEVSGNPFLSYVIDSLISYNYNHFVFSLGYKSEVIIEFIKTNYPKLNATYSIEEDPLFTGGAIRLGLEKCREHNVLIINADTYFGFDLDQFLSKHIDQNSDISIALKYMENFDRYGVVKFDENNVINSFEEKKFQKRGFINCGYIIIKKNVLMDMPLNIPFSFEKDFLFLNLSKLKLLAFVANGYFIDIGIPEDFIKSNLDFKGITSLNDLNSI